PRSSDNVLLVSGDLGLAPFDPRKRSPANSLFDPVAAGTHSPPGWVITEYRPLPVLAEQPPECPASTTRATAHPFPPQPTVSERFPAICGPLTVDSPCHPWPANSVPVIAAVVTIDR